MPPGRRRQPGMVLDEHPAIRPGRERHIHRSWSQPGPAAAGAGTPEGWFPDGPAGSVLVGRTAGRKRVPACGGDGNAVAVNRESRGDADVMDGGQHGGRNLRAERAGSVGSHHCSSPRHACAPTRVRRLWNWRAYMMKCRGSPTSTSNAPMNGRGRLLPRVRATRRVRPPGSAADESPRSHPGTPGTGDPSADRRSGRWATRSSTAAPGCGWAPQRPPSSVLAGGLGVQALTLRQALPLGHNAVRARFSAVAQHVPAIEACPAASHLHQPGPDPSGRRRQGMTGHVDGGAMRIRPWSSSRACRPPPRLAKNATRCRAVAPVRQRPRRSLSVTGSTLAWAQRAVLPSSASGVSLLAVGLVGELVSSASRRGFWPAARWRMPGPGRPGGQRLGLQGIGQSTVGS